MFLIDASGVGRRVLLDAAFDQTKWFANEAQTYEHTLAIPADIVPADYLLGVALVHPETEQPAIALGIAGDREGDRTYRIGTVRIH